VSFIFQKTSFSVIYFSLIVSLFFRTGWAEKCMRYKVWVEEKRRFTIGVRGPKSRRKLVLRLYARNCVQKEKLWLSINQSQTSNI